MTVDTITQTGCEDKVSHKDGKTGLTLIESDGQKIGFCMNVT